MSFLNCFWEHWCDWNHRVCWRKLFSWTFHINCPVTYNLCDEYEQRRYKNSLRMEQIPNSVFRYKRVLRYVRMASSWHLWQRLPTARQVMLVLADLTRCVYMCFQPKYHAVFSVLTRDVYRLFSYIATLKCVNVSLIHPLFSSLTSPEHKVAHLTTAGG